MFSPYCQNRMWGKILILSATLALLVIVLVAEQRDDLYSQPIVLSTSRPLPIQSCAGCHENETIAFSTSSHKRTLSSPQTFDRLEILRTSSARIGDHDYSWIVDESTKTLSLASDHWPQKERVDWLFGSGSHAITPVSLLTDVEGRTELLEHHASWYPGVGMSATLGVSNTNHSGLGIRSIGQVMNHEKTLECFGCHSTHLTITDGKLNEAEVVPGVQCARCHIKTHEHVHAMENNEGRTFMDDWKELTPLEAINRCGECHRRADQMMADELTPANRLLVRFAPVGLSQSACFKEQESVPGFAQDGRQFNCTTCHDPHQSPTRDAGFYVGKCLECHKSTADAAPLCTSQATTSECLSCHMPTVKVQEHLNLTDHWIRVPETVHE